MDTLATLRTEITNWLRGDYTSATDQTLITSAINDAIESIWSSMMTVQLARFFGLDSPVTFTLPSGAERVQLVSLADPTVAPVCSAQAGGFIAARTYLVSYTYITESGSETLPSPVTTFTFVAPSLLLVVQPPPQPVNAFGWNLYVGVTSPALQNAAPLAFGVPVTEPTSGYQDYPTSQQQPPVAQGSSQATPPLSPPPSENTTADNIAWITHLEIRSSDTLLRTWNQYDIDSEIMKRYGRTLSSASEYQTYVWDLINGNRLEVRPSAGLTFTPRYFYIAKPRRLRYDPATIPYLSVTGVREFLINNAIGKLKLGIDEYLASQQWGTAANAKRAEIMTALTQELWAKNVRIAPHLF